MRSFLEWYAEQGFSKPWLILGKGPSFARRDEYPTEDYHRLSLNHVVRELPVDVAHVIDLDVIEGVADAIGDNAGVLVMPWHPHVDCKASPRTLEEHAAEHPQLRAIDRAGKLLWYNLGSRGAEARPDAPVVEVKYFSAEAALNLLVEAGATTVRSLGVDGGADYAGDFEDLKDSTLLANTRSSFDRQFRSIARTIQRSGVDFAPLDVESPVRVYVATTEAQMLSVDLLEYSIKKHASLSVEVFPMHRAEIEIPMPARPANRPKTPFSFQRLLIPQLAGHRGRAIYVDSDMQVFTDIRELWTTPFGEHQIQAVVEPGDSGRRPQFAVMLMDCEALADWDIKDIVAKMDAGELDYKGLMYEMKIARSIGVDLHPGWNHLERYVEGETRLLHYTDMPTQPWVYAANPLGYLWTRDLFEAIDGGYIPLERVTHDIEQGWVRPSLMYQIEHRVEDGLLLPREAKALDKGFVAPYRQMAHLSFGGALKRPLQIGRAALRQAYRKTGLETFHRRVREYLTR